MRVSFGEDVFEQVGDFGEIGSRGRVYALDGRGEGELGVLGVEVVEPGLEPGESGVAACG